ncbi:MAG: hypothetical protein ACR2NR_02455 [Solirubrobacteraceae bacterium]
MSRRSLAHIPSASTTDFPAAAPVRSAQSPASERTSFGPWLSARNFYLGLIVVALAVGAFSLLIPSTPSYDPWSWLVWGREIIHLNLKTTGGPTWKPLPVIFTTVFALFGKAQPDLWLVVARAGAFATVVMVFRLSARFTRQIGAYFSSPTAGGNRTLAWLPALLAGVVAALGVAFSGGYISNNALGYSEGLATAVVLIALERHLDGHPRQAFAAGFLAALDRPEIWLFWGPYGLWLFWKDPEARKLVVALFVLIPILWFAPEYWGSGHFFRGVSRAQHVRSNSNALAKCPFCAELTKAAWPTVLLRVKVLAALLIIGAALTHGRRWLGERRFTLRDAPSRALAIAALAGVVGLSWWVLISILTQAGFSGNNRYLVIGSSLVDICGGVAWGLAACALGALLARVLRLGPADGTSAGSEAGRVVGVLVTAAVVLLLSPNLVTQDLNVLPRTHRALVYQAHLRNGAASLVRRYGRRQLLACGSVMTEGFQVPMVAWTLDVHTDQVLGPPPAGLPPGTAPNVILQTRASRNLALLPFLSQWPTVHYHYVGHSGPFRLFTHCV